MFPQTTGTDLMRRQVTLPVDLEGDVNLVLIAFQQWQQSQIDTWLPLAEHLEQTTSGFRYYELPVIQRLNVLTRTFINEGMRAGTPDASARARTIALYLDKGPFRRALDLPDEEQVYALLVDRQGTILWRASGVYTQDKAAKLPHVVERHLSQLSAMIDNGR